MKGSGCVAFRASGRVREVWLPKKDDGSGADTAFGPLRRHGLKAIFEIMAAADTNAPNAREDWASRNPRAT